jgi:hypothetical protein
MKLVRIGSCESPGHDSEVIGFMPSFVSAAMSMPNMKKSSERIIVVVRLNPPEKDVAIEEVLRPCHLAGPHRSFRARSFR